MDWKVIEKKLEGRSWLEIREILFRLGEVATEARNMSEIGEIVEMHSAFDEKQTSFLLSMASRYGLENIEEFRSALDKRLLSPRYEAFVRIQIIRILRLQANAANTYCRIRTWLESNVPFDLLFFYSSEVYRWWTEDNAERIQSFQELEGALKDYASNLEDN